MPSYVQKGSSSSSCGTTVIFLWPISFLFVATVRGYMATSAVRSTAFTTGTVNHICLQVRVGNVTIANNSKPFRLSSTVEREFWLKGPFARHAVLGNGI